MNEKVIINGKIILKDRVIEDQVLIYDRQILDITHWSEALSQMEIIDAGGHYVGPGFIDTHIHGFGGEDTMDGKPEKLRSMSRKLCRYGVTGFLPTTMTMEKDKIVKALDAIKIVMSQPREGARILGAHLEGPFINPNYKGAQNGGFILNPDIELIRDYVKVIKMITLAPEMDNQHQFIQDIREHTDIILSIGHSNATYQEALEAIEAGIINATHLFNAMRGLHHREPGVVGAVLKSNIYCELIPDNIHVHPALYTLIVDIKGVDRVLLVTDATKAAGLKPGSYDLGGQETYVTRKDARLKNGTLAGSILTMNQGVHHMSEQTNYDLPAIIAMASMNPATLLGLDKKKGSIEEGKDADLIIFDERIEIITTIIEGTQVYRKGDNNESN